MYRREIFCQMKISQFLTHLTWIFMDLKKFSENFSLDFINICFLSCNGFYMKCMLIATQGNFYFLLEFNQGEQDTFSGRAGIFHCGCSIVDICASTTSF